MCLVVKQERSDDTFRKISDVIHTIYEAVLHLPKPVRRVCIVSRSLIQSANNLGANRRLHGMVPVSVLLDHLRRPSHGKRAGS